MNIYDKYYHIIFIKKATYVYVGKRASLGWYVRFELCDRISKPVHELQLGYLRYYYTHSSCCHFHFRYVTSWMVVFLMGNIIEYIQSMKIIFRYF